MSFVSLEAFQLLSYDKQYFEIIEMLKFINKNKEDLIPEKLDKKIIWLYLMIEDIWYKNITNADILWLYWALESIINNFSCFDMETMFAKFQYIQAKIIENNKNRFSI